MPHANHDNQMLAEAMKPRNQWTIQDLDSLKGPQGDHQETGLTDWQETGPGSLMETMARIHDGRN